MGGRRWKCRGADAGGIEAARSKAQTGDTCDASAAKGDGRRRAGACVKRETLPHWGLIGRRGLASGGVKWREGEERVG